MEDGFGKPGALAPCLTASFVSSPDPRKSAPNRALMASRRPLLPPSSLSCASTVITVAAERIRICNLKEEARSGGKGGKEGVDQGKRSVKLQLMEQLGSTVVFPTREKRSMGRMIVGALPFSNGQEPMA